MKTKRFGNIVIPAIGQGAGGGDGSSDSHRIKVLRYGIELGMNLIDTAEAYGDGHSEEVVGKAIMEQREKVFVATKFSSEHNRYNDVIRALEGSLRRLNTDYVDLYQIHWPNPTIPLKETIDALTALKASGKVINVGVCNFSLDNLIEAQTLFDGKIFSNQIEYNLCDRIIENDIIPYSEQNEIAILAYNPLYQRRTSVQAILNKLAMKYDKTPVQIILNWLVSHTTVIPLQGTMSLEHTKENALAADFTMVEEDIVTINRFCMTKAVEVPTDRIRVVATDSKILCATMKEALENRFNLEPSPQELARDILDHGLLKPVRLIPSTDATGRYDYDLIRGQIRYWAWIIAHGSEVPIAAYINE